MIKRNKNVRNIRKFISKNKHYMIIGAITGLSIAIAVTALFVKRISAKADSSNTQDNNIVAIEVETEQEIVYCNTHLINPVAKINRNSAEGTVNQALRTATDAEVDTISTNICDDVHDESLVDYSNIKEPYKYYNIKFSNKEQEVIQDICSKHRLSYELMLGIMWVETRCTWHDGDNGNAIGYCQIWPKWWGALADDNGLNIYDKMGNIEVACCIINSLLNKNNGDLRCALQEYNSGNPYNTNNYADLVFNAINMLEATSTLVD